MAMARRNRGASRLKWGETAKPKVKRKTKRATKRRKSDEEQLEFDPEATRAMEVPLPPTGPTWADLREIFSVLNESEDKALLLEKLAELEARG